MMSALGGGPPPVLRGAAEQRGAPARSVPHTAFRQKNVDGGNPHAGEAAPPRWKPPLEETLQGQSAHTHGAAEVSPGSSGPSICTAPSAQGLSPLSVGTPLWDSGATQGPRTHSQSHDWPL